MNKFLFIILFSSHLAMGQADYSLQDIVNLAHENSLNAKIAKAEKDLAYWEYRGFKATFKPQLTLEGDLPNYSRDYQPNRQDDNSIEYQLREQSDGDLTLSLEQPLAATGGVLSLNSNLNQFRDYREDETLWNNTLINVTLDQPLFGFNSLKWDKRVEPLVYEESKREYIESLESIAVDGVDLFFEYLEAQVDLQIAEFNLNNTDTIFQIEQGRYDIGSTTKDQLLEVELQLLTSKQNLAKSQSAIRMSKLELNALTGLSLEGFSLLIPDEIPEFEISTEEAMYHAKANRADYIGFERRRLEEQRDVADAKSDLYTADMELSYGLNGTSTDLKESYGNTESQQVLNLSIDLPLLSGGRSKANIKTAQVRQELVNYEISLEEQTFEREILTQVNEVMVLKNQIEIATKADKIAQERYLVSQSIYLIGKIDISKLTQVLQQKDSTKRSYLKALREFWKAYYELRELTLYDFINQKPLYISE